MQFEGNGLSDEVLVPKDPWFAVYTRHQHEKTVCQNLTGRGFETFVPLYETVHQWKDRIKLLSMPLFPAMYFSEATSDVGWTF